jgi:dienelactone hydrolase
MAFRGLLLWLRRALLGALALLAGVLHVAVVARAAPPHPQKVHFLGADGITLEAYLYRPEGNGPFPAVVALHGCDGLTRKRPNEPRRLTLRHQDWGERLAARGFIVLFPDSFRSRSETIISLCEQKEIERPIHPWKERVDDAKASFAYLASRPDVAKGSISLLGWSNGAISALYSITPENAPANPPDFARVVAFYPGCKALLDGAHVPGGTWHTRVPLLVLIGEADDWTCARHCKQLIDGAKDSGDRVSIVAYPCAYHSFDHPSLAVEVKDELGNTCSGTGKAHVGTNPDARADAIARVPAFLAGQPQASANPSVTGCDRCQHP